MTSWFRFDLWECVGLVGSITFTLGQAGGLVVYLRNLVLIRRKGDGPAAAA